MWPNPQETAGLVTFTEEILNGKLHFLCSVSASMKKKHSFGIVSLCPKLWLIVSMTEQNL